MAGTVFLLDGYGWSGMLRYANIPLALGANGGTFVQVPYNNNIAGSPSNIQSAAQTLNTYLTGNYTPPFVVCGISMGTQVAYKWLRDYGPSSAIPAANLSFVLLANPENAYTGSAVLDTAAMLPAGTYGGLGAPANTPYTVTNVIRQYDGVADYPNVSTPNSTAIQNALIGMFDIHDAYMFVNLDDTHYSVTDGNITTSWYGPTYPAPTVAPFSILNYFLGIKYNPATADWTQSQDMQVRPTIEQSYNRPVKIPAPDYSGGATVTVSAALSVAPVVSASANLPTGSAISVAPVVSASGSVSGGTRPMFVDLTVTPAVDVTAETLVNAAVSVMPTVTPAVYVQGIGTAAMTVTPSVSASTRVVGSVAMTVAPTVSASGSVTVPAPQFDAVGAGYNATGTPTWSHTASQGADVFVLVASFDASYAPTSVTYGATSMTNIGTANGQSNSVITLWHLQDAPSGSQTITATGASYSVAQSVSFTNVSSVGAPVTSSASASTTASQSVSCGGNQIILHSFASYNNAFVGETITETGGTNVYATANASYRSCLAVNYASTTTTFNGSATGSASNTSWNGIAVVLS